MSYPEAKYPQGMGIARDPYVVSYTQKVAKALAAAGFEIESVRGATAYDITKNWFMHTGHVYYSRNGNKRVVHIDLDPTEAPLEAEPEGAEEKAVMYIESQE